MMMKLQSFLKILLLSNIALGQVTLSKEEVRNIANKIDSLQTLDSLNNSIILDYKDKVKRPINSCLSNKKINKMTL